MVKLLPLKLGSFHVCNPGHTWRCIIMEQNHTLREQLLSFILDGPAKALECLTIHIGGNGSSVLEEFKK